MRAVDSVGARAQLGAKAYGELRRFVYAEAGIDLGDAKQTLVYSRLIGRVEALQLSGFEAYVQRLNEAGQEEERQNAIDLLSTNETYFNREPEHFKVLQEHTRRLADARGVVQVWSAACSSGEEVYTIAMALQSLVDRGLRISWELMGSDISTRMLEVARRGTYPESRLSNLPADLRKAYCLRGQGPAAGTALVVRELRARVRFERVNLIEPLPKVGPFDVIFLRIVLIYFDRATKQRVIAALAARLRPGGLLVVGLSDGVLGLTGALRSLGPGVYTLPAD
jgi:chemotaxis protein methyltransferase CheR